MSGISTISDERICSLVSSITRTTATSPETIIPFVDLSDAFTALFRLSHSSVTDLLVAGHAGPDIALAADRAGLRIREHLGTSPFAADPDGLAALCTTGRETVYIANPNRVTGSNYGRADLELIARAVPHGLVVVDEYYFDFFNITAAPLLERSGNIAIVRSFTAAFGIASSEAGFVIASPIIASRLEDFRSAQRFTTTLYRILSTTLEHSEARVLRVKLLNDEALRLAGDLNALSIRSRISPTDFLLLRVADPARFGNALAKAKVDMHNLDGYPELRQYVRYTIQSPLNNENLLNAVRRMPREYYVLDSIDRRLTKLRTGAEARPDGGIDATRVVERSTAKPVIIRDDETVLQMP